MVAWASGSDSWRAVLQCPFHDAERMKASHAHHFQSLSAQLVAFVTPHGDFHCCMPAIRPIHIILACKHTVNLALLLSYDGPRSPDRKSHAHGAAASAPAAPQRLWSQQALKTSHLLLNLAPSRRVEALQGLL